MPKVDCLTDFVRMLLKEHILRRYYFLLESNKSKNDRLPIVCKKLTGLWAKLNFPLLTEKDAIYRLICLIKQYEKYQRRPTSKFEAEMSKIFNILQNQMKSGCARRPWSFIKIKLNLLVVLDISQIKRLPWAPLTHQKENFWRNLLMEAVNLQQQW